MNSSFSASSQNVSNLKAIVSVFFQKPKASYTVMIWMVSSLWNKLVNFWNRTTHWPDTGCSICKNATGKEELYLRNWCYISCAENWKKEEKPRTRTHQLKFLKITMLRKIKHSERFDQLRAGHRSVRFE